jgi:hypothetical protein
MNVGASLLAKAVCQSKMCRLTWRIREQARSHKGITAVGSFAANVLLQLFDQLGLFGNRFFDQVANR